MARGQDIFQGEHRFMEYDYLIKETGKRRMASRAQVFKHLETCGIKISANTFYMLNFPYVSFYSPQTIQCDMHFTH